MRGRGRGPIGGRGDGGRGRFGGGRGRGRGKFGKEGGHAESHKDGGDSVRRVGRTKVWLTSEDALQASFRYQIFTEGKPRLGWLLNMVSSAMDDPNNDNTTYSCVNLYFMCQDGSTFKAQVRFAPYFYLGTKENTELEVDSSLRRRYEGQIANIEIVNKEDLDLVMQAVEVDVGLDMVVSGMEVVDMEGDKDKEREEKILSWHALEKSNWSLRKAMAVGL